jgi:hypothetical protein
MDKEIISRKDAKVNGSLRYFTGKMCPRGHISERFVSNSACMECGGIRHAKWAKENPDKRRKQGRKYQNLPESTRILPDNCEGCGVHISRLNRSLHLDHDHQTGEFRGWLCGKCNRGLGFFGDSINGIKMILEYLQRNMKNE